MNPNKSALIKLSVLPQHFLRTLRTFQAIPVFLFLLLVVATQWVPINHGIALLWLTAVSTIGAVFGYLFGIPRPLSHAAPSADDARSARVNTNLEEISDWLTKIILGIGLVELHRLPQALQITSEYIGVGLGPGSSAQNVATALLIGGLSNGFVAGYLLTKATFATYSKTNRTETPITSSHTPKQLEAIPGSSPSEQGELSSRLEAVELALGILTARHDNLSTDVYDGLSALSFTSDGSYISDCFAGALYLPDQTDENLTASRMRDALQQAGISIVQQLPVDRGSLLIYFFGKVLKRFVSVRLQKYWEEVTEEYLLRKGVATPEIRMIHDILSSHSSGCCILRHAVGVKLSDRQGRTHFYVRAITIEEYAEFRRHRSRMMKELYHEVEELVSRAGTPSSPLPAAAKNRVVSHPATQTVVQPNAEGHALRNSQIANKVVKEVRTEKQTSTTSIHSSDHSDKEVRERDSTERELVERVVVNGGAIDSDVPEVDIVAPDQDASEEPPPTIPDQEEGGVDEAQTALEEHISVEDSEEQADSGTNNTEATDLPKTSDGPIMAKTPSPSAESEDDAPQGTVPAEEGKTKTPTSVREDRIDRRMEPA